jgi:hypothetical protein
MQTRTAAKLMLTEYRLYRQHIHLYTAAIAGLLGLESWFLFGFHISLVSASILSTTDSSILCTPQD